MTFDSCSFSLDSLTVLVLAGLQEKRNYHLPHGLILCQYMNMHIMLTPLNQTSRLCLRIISGVVLSPWSKEQKEQRKKASADEDATVGKAKCWLAGGRVRLSHLLGSLICVLISRNATVGMWRLHKDDGSVWVCVCLWPARAPSLLAC